MAATETQNAPAYFYHQQYLAVEYSFLPTEEIHYGMHSAHLWLDIVLEHPHRGGSINIRVIKSNLIVCQPREVIEAVVHREIRHFLQQDATTIQGDFELAEARQAV